ncbi:protein NETWORKED 2A [Carica papaya]|uniref:protein NETWORKED 2A n=1 Tax=Carica papaya TaxID=3649 RepID=UPI000B8CACB6|nr:protein NETWORKED 2A [Carica papaya]
MLQRAATNAYSWWWASHIRTKQSKWLEQNLQDMEEKVNYTLKIIDEDGDTFAKRAEMYYKKRPEIVNFVEEAFRSYRALAERYDHLSRELQSANRTIATAFPEQVPVSLDEDDHEGNPDGPSRNLPNLPIGRVPKAPDIPKKDLRCHSMLLTRKKVALKRTSTSTIKTPPPISSGLSKDEALKEIDKLQKGILRLQTEKEFVRSTYENAYEKYWEIEDEITELQKKVCSLQDEFGIGTVIEDNEARSLMADTAIKSCQETLCKLEEKQKQSVEEARVECTRIQKAHQKFANLKKEFLPEENVHDEEAEEETESASENPQFSEAMEEEKLDLKLLRDRIKEELEADSSSNLTVTQLAEKIDELVNKVVTLETTVSSQTALVKRLRSETDELHSHIHILEEDRDSLASGSDNMNSKIKQLEEELNRVKNLNQSIEARNTNLQTHFTEANCNIDHLSDKLKSVQIEDVRTDSSAKLEKEVEQHEPDNKQLTSKHMKISEEKKDNHTYPLISNETEKENHNDPLISNETGDENYNSLVPRESEKHDIIVLEKPPESVPEEKAEKKYLSETASSIFDVEAEESGTEDEEDHSDWRQVFSTGFEDREKILLEEYTSVVRNYREVKRKLNMVEKKNRDGFFELALQIRELKNAVSFRDVEIQTLRQKLNSSEKDSGENPDGHQSECRYSHPEEHQENISQITSCPESNVSSPTPLNRSSTRQVNISSPNPLSLSSPTPAHVSSPSPLSLLSPSPVISLLPPSPVNISTPSSNQQQDEPGETISESPQQGDLKNPKSVENEVKKKVANNPNVVQTVEERIRSDIDELLEENLEFWLRFSTAFHQIQKFQTAVQDLRSELLKLKQSRREEEEGSVKQGSFGSDARPIYKHLKQIQTELTLWLENNAILKDELKGRYSSLCNIQDEVSRVTGASQGVRTVLSEFQAAKFHGEILNMKQENNKISNELQAGVDRVKILKVDIEKTVSQLEEELGIFQFKDNSSQTRGSSGRPRIPLRSFLFGVKLKRHKQQKASLFSCMSPQLQKQYSYAASSGRP